MRLIPFRGFSLGNVEKYGKTAVFFGAAMAGLGKYFMGGYGQIEVYRAVSYYIYR